MFVHAWWMNCIKSKYFTITVYRIVGCSVCTGNFSIIFLTSTMTALGLHFRSGYNYNTIFPFFKVISRIFIFWLLVSICNLIPKQEKKKLIKIFLSQTSSISRSVFEIGWSWRPWLPPLLESLPNVIIIA